MGGRASSSPSTRSTSLTACCGSRSSPATMSSGPRAPPARVAHRWPTGRASASGDGRNSGVAKVNEDLRFPTSFSFAAEKSRIQRGFGIGGGLLLFELYRIVPCVGGGEKESEGAYLLR